MGSLRTWLLLFLLLRAAWSLAPSRGSRGSRASTGPLAAGDPGDVNVGWPHAGHYIIISAGQCLLISCTGRTPSRPSWLLIHVACVHPAAGRRLLQASSPPVGQVCPCRLPWGGPAFCAGALQTREGVPHPPVHWGTISLERNSKSTLRRTMSLSWVSRPVSTLPTPAPRPPAECGTCTATTPPVFPAGQRWAWPCRGRARPHQPVYSHSCSRCCPAGCRRHASIGRRQQPRCVGQGYHQSGGPSQRGGCEGVCRAHRA